MTQNDTSCPSDLMWDRFLTQELTPQESEPLTQHLSQCAQCRTLYNERSMASAAWRGQALPLSLARAAQQNLQATSATPNVAQPPRKSGKQRLLTVPTLALASAAALLLVIVYPSFKNYGTSAVGERTKGGAFQLQAVVQRAAGTSRLQTGDKVSAGDRVRFGIRTKKSGYVAIVGYDATRMINVYVADTKRRALKVGATSDTQWLEEGVEFDSTPGQEHVIALWCPNTFDVTAWVEQLQSAANRGSHSFDLTTTALALPESQCRVDRITWPKRSAP